jgi:DHA3 family multidrug efflux protein-like MFS transporter
MTDGALAQSIGGWFGTGPDRGMALIFIVAGMVGLAVTLLALLSAPYRELSARYAQASSEAGPADGEDAGQEAVA